MEIERINENTVKFYISYLDIEDRGFEKEEIWYNRERSEQLFWQMMEEVNFKEEDFTVEGPLWIQVQALEKGLEVVVTKAQVSKDGENIELSLEDQNTIDIPVSGSIEKMLGNKANSKDEEVEPLAEEENSWTVVHFDDFEAIIQLSYYFENTNKEVEETLYHYDNKYYLYMEFYDDMLDANNQENFISQVLEFANESKVTFHLLEEYGKKVFDKDTFVQIRSYFNPQI